MCKWEQEASKPLETPFVFPSNTLLARLISLYFRHVNIHLPLLHEPTFQINVVEGLHLKDRHFGAVVLAVCAVAARYAGVKDQEEVLLVPGHSASAGWVWFQQIHPVKISIFERPCLYELQYYCVSFFVPPLSPLPFLILAVGFFTDDFAGGRVGLVDGALYVCNVEFPWCLGVD